MEWGWDFTMCEEINIEVWHANDNFKEFVVRFPIFNKFHINDNWVKD